MKNLFTKIASWFKKPEKKSLREMYKEAHPEPIKEHNMGRSAYFHNNRKRTRGRNLQYILMPNGRTKVIRHETI